MTTLTRCVRQCTRRLNTLTTSQSILPSTCHFLLTSQPHTYCYHTTIHALEQKNDRGYPLVNESGDDNAKPQQDTVQPSAETPQHHSVPPFDSTVKAGSNGGYNTSIENRYDLLIIGSGPAGQKAAINASKMGKRVAIVDKRGMLGGMFVMCSAHHLHQSITRGDD